MRCDKATLVVTGSALLAISSMGFLCCPTAHAGSPGGVKSAFGSPPRPNSGEPEKERNGPVLRMLRNKARQTFPPAPQNWGGGASPAPVDRHPEVQPKPAAPPDGDDSLDDDRAEHWAVPSIAREERVQIAALTIGLAGAGALGLRRKALLKGQKRHE